MAWTTFFTVSQGALNLAGRLGLNMPDVPHVALMAMLLDAWDCVVHKTGNIRKQMYRKVPRQERARISTFPAIIALKLCW